MIDVNVRNATMRKCGSPIEKQFLEAWMELVQVFYPYSTFEPIWSLVRFQSLSETSKFTSLHVRQLDVVCQQAPIDNYFADFALGRVVMQGDILKKLAVVVVECDGHDFHEKTKEQAQHDKARDRVFVSLEYRVLRFTGSEIHRDAHACALEVDNLFTSIANPSLRIA